MLNKLCIYCILFPVIASADIATVSPDKIDFGSTVLTTSSLRYATISNPTKKDLNISSITTSGDFWIPQAVAVGPGSSPQRCGSVVFAGTQCVVPISFSPTVLGTEIATLTVTDDAPSSPQKIKLSGTGIPVQLISIVINPSSPSVPLGKSQSFQAIGNYNNNTSQDLTNSVAWASSSAVVATISASGVAITGNQGTTTISATSGSVSSSIILTVTPPVVTSILVSPSNPSIAKGDKQQFTASARLSNGINQDITSSAQWSSTAPSAATISATGLATGISQGTSVISASISGVVGSTQLSVTPPALRSISLSPMNVSIGLGATQQFTLTGTYSDTSTQDLTSSATWSIINPPSSTYNIASVNSTGFVTGLNLGWTTIRALVSGLNTDARANLEVAFDEVSPMSTARFFHTATFMSSGPMAGEILLLGGNTNFTSGTILATSDVFNYSTSMTSTGPSMNTPRAAHTATLLPNGTILVAGGQQPGGSLSSAEVFDPNTGLFTYTGSMITPRAGHTATLLDSGRVLIVGGTSDSNSAELYDPSTGVFSATGNTVLPRTGHSATLLNDGRVLIAGGLNTTLAEIYDPATGSFSSTGNLTTERNYGAAALLGDGTVLLTGGFPNGSSPTPQSSAELYDPAAGTFTLTAGPMSKPRAFHTATLLQNGQVLVAGGSTDYSNNIDRYDPISRTFAGTGSMATGHISGIRSGHTATFIPDGKSHVLLTGGDWMSLSQPLGYSVEFYHPGVSTVPGLLAPSK